MDDALSRYASTFEFLSQRETEWQWTQMIANERSELRVKGIKKKAWKQRLLIWKWKMLLFLFVT